MFYWNFVFSCNNNVSNNVNVPYTYLHFWLFSKGSPYIITYSLTISDATICDFLSAGFFVFLADWPVWFISAQINEYFNLSHVTRIRLLFKKMYEDPSKEFRYSFQWFRSSFFQWKILSKPAHTSSLYFHVQETFHKIWIYFLFNSFSVYCLLYKHLFLSNFAYLKIKIIFTESTILKWIISEWVAGRQKMRF